MADFIRAQLQAYAESIFECGRHSVHGSTHWDRVYELGMLIGKEEGADLMVVAFFAYLHDSCRRNDGRDLNHGPRAAIKVESLPDELKLLDNTQEETLRKAIHSHTEGIISNDPTIGTCWDADRLDLGRVGIIPDPERMCTDSGRRIAYSGTID